MQFHLFLHPGPSICHPLRTRTRGTPRCGRYTALTCLICEALVYRVYQVVPIDIEGKEGPLLPTEEWVENEIMKSSSGWIEVSNQCLVSDRLIVSDMLQYYASCCSHALLADWRLCLMTHRLTMLYKLWNPVPTIHHCFPWYYPNYPRLLQRSKRCKMPSAPLDPHHHGHPYPILTK